MLKRLVPIKKQQTADCQEDNTIYSKPAFKKQHFITQFTYKFI